MNVQDPTRFGAKADRPGLVAGYMSGFGNSFETEALAGALPVGRNSPQKVKFGLYAEQLSGSPFTAPQSTNQRSWLYRIRPTVKHSARYRRIDKGLMRTAPAAREESDLPIGQLRWGPIPIPHEKLTFVSGLRTMTTAGDAETRAGMAAHVLLVTASMGNEYFFNADGELLIVAQENKLRFRTEFGVIDIAPGEICVIQRGMIFKVELIDGPARAYMCENYGGAFTLPYRGPIGANCLANPRDFLTPVAAYEDKDEPSTLHNCMLPHGPDETAFEHASNSELKPVKLTDTMAFMFETRFPQRLTKYAADLKERQDDYIDCWRGLRRHFDPSSAKP